MRPNAEDKGCTERVTAGFVRYGRAGTLEPSGAAKLRIRAVSGEPHSGVIASVGQGVTTRLRVYRPRVASVTAVDQRVDLAGQGAPFKIDGVDRPALTAEAGQKLDKAAALDLGVRANRGA